MSKKNGTAAADVVERQAKHQEFLANNLALDLGNRMTSYRAKTDITDWFISVGASKALLASIIAMSKSEEQANANLLQLVHDIAQQVPQAWADRIAAEKAQGGQA